jgi:diguanylate cyclase (GGDEF)-like protein
MSAAAVDQSLIRKTELFSSLPQNEIDYVISHSGTLSLPKGGVLFTSGEKAKNFYILKKGVIRVFQQKSDSSEDEMARFTEGDTIGDFDFARGADYDANAEADEDSELIVFPNSGITMDTLAKEEPRIICSILLNAIIMMTGRIKSTRKLVLENMSWVQELHRRAYEDSGTGLWKQILITDEIIGALNDPSALIMLKPDRFKILVDSRGHSAGDEAMIKIALILKNITRILGHGWPLRFKSNEVGLIISNCGAAQAQEIAKGLFDSVAALEPVPAEGEAEEFKFSAAVSWTVWPQDEAEWDSLFQGCYSTLLDTWKSGGNTIIHYNKADKK